MKKLAIFDLDGTLLYSLEDLADATNYALQKNGLPIQELDKYKYFVGNGVFKLIERALPEEFKKNEAVFNAVLSDFRTYYGEHSEDKSKLYDGIEETVNKLHEMGVLLAVASNKPDEFTKVLVSRLFGDLFDYAQGSLPEIPTKPAPDIAFMILEKFGISADDAVFIGDTNVDMNTGKAAGIETIGCLWGYRTFEELKEAGADYIIEKPSEIVDIVL